MELFLQTSLSFPVVLLSFLLCVAILYWLVAALGLVEVDVLDIEADSLQPEGLAGVLLKLGLNGVPVTLVLTLLFFFAWLICYFAELLLLRFLPLGILRYPLGVAVALASALVAVPLVGFLVRPLRPLFRKLEASGSQSLLGQVALVRSGRVTPDFGEATLEDGGAGLILRIRAADALGLKRGDRVVLLEYLEAEHAYRVITEDEFRGI
ncbi:hypothetical protein [Zestomonas carbonaria]|uniref:DUF1449 family protein n=1 Tax=Zestomonas carbonaria TaxID=2762745 RepID=A0A7U7I8U2_9GAMM|nr:hypothetical protein [Pseudomonas carbonaria]CAD5107516.1 hypothetical protein PSEWESI4_01789 [Pseudomonas carbonaria]